MSKIRTLKVWPNSDPKHEGEPYIAQLKEPMFHEIEWATGLQESEGSVTAGDRLVHTLWHDGDEEIKKDTVLRTKASKAVWSLIPVGETEMEEDGEGGHVIKVWRSKDEREQGEEPYRVHLREIGFEDIGKATQTQEQNGLIAGGNYLLENLWKDGDKEVFSDNALRLTACVEAFRLTPAGTAEIEGESTGIGDSSTGTSTPSEQPSSDTIGKQEG